MYAAQGLRQQSQVQPRLDWANPIVTASRALFCASFGGGVADVVRGTTPTYVGAANVSYPYQRHGKSLSMTAATGTQLSYAGYGTSALTAWTFAAMIRFPASMGTEYVLANDSTGSGIRITVANPFKPNFSITKGGVVALTTLLVPGDGFSQNYFCIASHDEATDVYYYRLKNLDTGEKAVLDSTTTSVANGSDGKVTFGDIIPGTTDDAFSGHIYFGYIGGAFLREGLADQWIDDPWQIFSRQQPRYWVNAAAAAGTRPVKMAGRWGGFAGASGGFAG